jgi:hypothetical protein
MVSYETCLPQAGSLIIIHLCVRKFTCLFHVVLLNTNIECLFFIMNNICLYSILLHDI